MKITVLSSGSWGTALAKTLCDNNHEVYLWSRSKEYSDAMEAKKENFRYLPGYTLPDNLHLTADFAKAIENADLIVTATPTQYIRQTLEMLKEQNCSAPICNVSKGIEVSSLKRISEITSEILGETHPFCVLVGPSHAEELIKNMPTAVVASSQFTFLAKKVQSLFMNQNFRVYTSSDLVGVELGGALKNIFAIAAGVIDGLGLGDNTKAALMTRGNVEMARLGRALGGFEETFNGLSGIGDLIVTCTSKHSRNRSVGEMLGKGLSMEQIKEKLGHSVAEGVATTKSAYQLAQNHGVETPIIEQCYQVLYENRSPAEAINYLMTRDAKKERN
ncbi:NAD(P)-dependent glycerol-3-phosphate dehydrogenase [Lentisphaera profundi]|uniref:Glycerol-3-phosphate dehydrogenase [NAD(P)+] n=1 Tax=Lentisphaera profundi TaxID=1658616 RepID=A0ABY7VRK9_9BACT|nr:NAD(P)H-dependent glycerol-3-phosphate dehydrogenase [Lentisphaera profundi]WDE95501.1 NAD(P)-dependent glycerol-3-phosphate dehydrogenase [Lentisphaera profundi]